MDNHGLGPETTTIEVSCKEGQEKLITRDVDLGVGDFLILRLHGVSGSTGYSWTAAQIGDSAVVEETSCEFIGPSGHVIGGEGTDVWTFKALHKGTTTIVTEFRGPGPATGEPVCSFKANVTARILLRSNQIT